jgi:hypothetical protein
MKKQKRQNKECHEEAKKYPPKQNEKKLIFGFGHELLV